MKIAFREIQLSKKKCMNTKKCDSCSGIYPIKEFIQYTYIKNGKEYHYTVKRCRRCENKIRRERRANNMSDKQKKTKEFVALKKEMKNKGYIYCNTCKEFRCSDQIRTPSIINNQSVLSIKTCKICNNINEAICSTCGNNYFPKIKLKKSSKNHYCSIKCKNANKNNDYVRYGKSSRERLSDPYVKQRIYSHTNLKSNDIPQSMVDAYREHLRLKRLIKDLSNPK